MVKEGCFLPLKTRKAPEEVPSIKQVEALLRDPNSVAVRPSGFDCVRPCHSERCGAESSCEAAPSKAKMESRADYAHVAVRPSGFDCVRPCHSERSGAESSCEAAPSKAKVESRADYAQDDTQGQHLPRKIKRSTSILFVLLFTSLAPQTVKF